MQAGSFGAVAWAKNYSPVHMAAVENLPDVLQLLCSLEANAAPAPRDPR